MIYTVTFNPAADYTVRLPSLKCGEMNRTSEETCLWGGKGINVSTVLEVLETESTALGFIAGFTGKALEKEIGEMGIKTDFITLPRGMTRICTKIYEEDTGRETEINAGGPEIDGKSLALLLDKLSGLDKGDILVLAGSVPHSVPSDIYETICARLESKGVLICADASGELLTKLLKYSPFLVKPNHIEAGEICGITADTPERAEACALRLRVMGARNVIVSMAGNGAVLAAEDGNVYRMEAPRGEVINSVGAGDSMLAGFIAGYIRTGDFGKALLWGTAAGSATAFSRGLCGREDFDRVFESIGEIKQ